jgi:microcystin-dependent protein
MDTPMIGSIAMFAADFAPRGWAQCQGQLLSIAQNSALFSILGTTYGGDGRTTFALPNLCGRTAMQQGQGPGLTPVDLGEVSGATSVTLQASELPAHTHITSVTINAAADGRAGSDSPAGAVLDNGSSIYASAPDGNTRMNAGAATVAFGAAGGSQLVGIQNPYLGITYIIALQGIFPSRN